MDFNFYNNYGLDYVGSSEIDSLKFGMNKLPAEIRDAIKESGTFVPFSPINSTINNSGTFGIDPPATGKVIKDPVIHRTEIKDPPPNRIDM